MSDEYAVLSADLLKGRIRDAYFAGRMASGAGRLVDDATRYADEEMEWLRKDKVAGFTTTAGSDNMKKLFDELWFNKEKEVKG